LFAELTAARLDRLDTLRRIGPCSVSVLAKLAGCDDANVDTDVSRLKALGLIERSGDSSVSVPFTAVEIIIPLAQVA
jgi:predicted transcriptional regulator